jgi:hypothetical protein
MTSSCGAETAAIRPWGLDVLGPDEVAAAGRQVGHLEAIADRMVRRDRGRQRTRQGIGSR